MAPLLFYWVSNVENSRKDGTKGRRRRHLIDYDAELEPTATQVYGFKFNMLRKRPSVLHQFYNTLLSQWYSKTITAVNYDTDYYNSPLI